MATETLPKGLAQKLEEVAARADPRRLERDPVGLVRGARDKEAAALIAASLAFGNAQGIRASVGRALEAFEGDRRALRGFRHRWIGERELRRLFDGIGRARDKDGSLEATFRGGHEEVGPALDAFCTRLRGPRPGRSLRFLLPRPADGSACKRPLLFLRWVVRGDDGVDLGLWRHPAPAQLIVPLDTHVRRIAYWIGLTDRHDASWRTAVDVTESLRVIDPRDPVRFDFALAHLGILKECPKEPVQRLCTRCPLNSYCRVWQGEGRRRGNRGESRGPSRSGRASITT